MSWGCMQQQMGSSALPATNPSLRHAIGARASTACTGVVRLHLDVEVFAGIYLYSLAGARTMLPAGILIRYGGPLHSKTLEHLRLLPCQPEVRRGHPLRRIGISDIANADPLR